MKTIQIRLPDHIHEKVKKLAEALASVPDNPVPDSDKI